MSLHMIFLLNNNSLGRAQINNLIKDYIKTTFGSKSRSGFLIILASSKPIPIWRRMLDPLAFWETLFGLQLKPWGILDFLHFGERIEVLLGPGLVLPPKDFQGERSVSVFPHGFLLFWKIWGRDYFWIILSLSVWFSAINGPKITIPLPLALHIPINGTPMNIMMTDGQRNL